VPPPRGWGSGSLHELLEETLAPERLAAQGVFRPETVERLRREHVSGQRDHTERLWALVLATRWLGKRALPGMAAPARAAG
jgi:asparagine synthase (glutamine-hydrolysing)